MDLPPLPRALTASGGTIPAASAEVSALLAKLPAGTLLEAWVEKVRPLPESERSALLSANPTTTAGRKSDTLPAALNASAKLFEVTLKILGKPLITLANISPPTNEKLPVLLRANGELQLLSLKGQHSPEGDPASPKTTTTPPSPTQAAGLARPQPSPAKLSAALATLTDGLRRYLPQQQPLAETFSHLARLVKALQQVNAGQTEGQAQQSLVKLLRLAPPIDSLSRPEGLQAAIKSSGALLESQLRQVFHQARQTSSPAPLHTGVRIPGAPPIPPAPAAPEPSTTASTANQEQSPQQPLASDLKAALLQALNQLPANATSPGEAPRGELHKAIEQLLQGLLRQAQTSTEANPRDARPQTQLAALLRPLLQGALARISSLQIQHLMQTLQDGGTTAALTIELPVRMQEHYWPLIIQIQERPYREAEEREKQKADDKRRERHLKKRWQLFMSFELDELGSFASEVDIQDSQVRTRLWVEKTPLWQLAQEQLGELRQVLEANGMEVEELICHRGAAPAREMKIDHRLVDVRT